MRTVFLFLVLVNLGFFAWANFVSETDTQSDPRPLSRQVNPEKLRIVPPSGPAKPATETRPAAIACLEWGSFAPGDVPRAGEALAPLELGPRLTQRQTDDSASWWVFMPPRANRQDAQKKAIELKALGVEEYFIVQEEGPNRYALSLGIFKTEAAATSHLEALRARGVKTAQVGRRDTQSQRVVFQIRTVEEPLAAKLRELAQSFGGSEVRECVASPG